MSQNSIISFERISEEAHGDASVLWDDSDRLSDLGLDSLPIESFLSDFIISGECHYTNFPGMMRLLNNK